MHKMTKRAPPNLVCTKEAESLLERTPHLLTAGHVIHQAALSENMKCSKEFGVRIWNIKMLVAVVR